MKTTLFAALLGSAAAFAPAPASKASTALSAEKSPAVPFLPYPENLKGYVGDDIGFDPLRISDYFPMDYLREAELNCFVNPVNIFENNPSSTETDTAVFVCLQLPDTSPLTWATLFTRMVLDLLPLLPMTFSLRRELWAMPLYSLAYSKLFPTSVLLRCCKDQDENPVTLVSVPGTWKARRRRRFAC